MSCVISVQERGKKKKPCLVVGLGLGELCGGSELRTQQELTGRLYGGKLPFVAGLCEVK